MKLAQLARLASLAFALLLVHAAVAQSNPDAQAPQSKVDKTPEAKADKAPDAKADQAPDAKKEPEEPRGLKLHASGAFDGLTIIQPLRSKDVHLIDMEGKVVHTWHTNYSPGAWLHLRNDGTLFRAGTKEEKARFHGGGIGGVIQQIDWDGKVLWEYELASDSMRLHHDFEVLPNGNLLAIAWENHTKEEAVARGRDEDEIFEQEGLWPDAVLELKPTMPKGAEVVWAWHAWDHLVQDRDPKKAGYAKIADRPGRFDINAEHRYEKKKETPEERKKRLDLEAEMKKLGYAGGDPEDAPAKGAPKEDAAKASAVKADAAKTGPANPDAVKSDPQKPGDPKADPAKPDAPKPPEPTGDFMHTNAIAYLPSEDLVLLSSPEMCEIYVIDHSTTTAEAAGSTGGKRGKGGDILWRWGNPQNYGMGTAADKRCFYQHNPNWLASSKDGELRLLFFNNGKNRAEIEFSSVDELVLPFTHASGFVREEGRAFGPEKPAWSYSDPEKFVSQFISGAQRLPNGDTLICEGKTGRVFEVTKDGAVVWDYLNPLGGEVEPSATGGKAPPKALFRAVRIPRDHPGLKGKSL